MPALAPLLAVLLAALAQGSAGAGDCRELSLGPIGSTSEDLIRLAELTGATPVTPQLFRRWSSRTSAILCPERAQSEAGAQAATARRLPHPALEALPVSWRTYLNTGYPDDRNDGALWEGRGISTEVTGGVRLHWRFLSAAVAPVAAWQQNRDFFRPAMTMPGYSPYANPFDYGNIDLPLRFGPSDFWTLDPGQSYARIDLWGVALGVSTENLWWGPGVRNSLLMTNTAPGFPHVFLGTSEPVDIWIGTLEAQFVWGRLRESKWFDTDPTDDRRLFTALTIGYGPRWIPGLFLGLARVYLYRIPPGGLPTRDYLAPLFGPFFKEALATSTSDGSSPDNQLASIFARWAFPDAGLEIYGEWGRDDHSWDLKDFVTQPEHAQAFMLGLQKVFSAGPRWVRVTAELAHTLEKPTNNPTRGVPIFYTHGDERQGYTQDGQMLGAGIGPQADSQFLAVDLFHAHGRAGLWVERILRNDRWFYDQVHTWQGEDAELAGGLRGLWSWLELDVEASLGLAQRYNLNFGPDVSSVKGMMELSWHPGRESIPALPARSAARPPG